MALSTIIWNVAGAGGGGDWHNASNWIGGKVPGASDLAVIPKLPTLGVVYLNRSEGSSVGGLLTDPSATLQVYAGSLSVGADSSSTFGGDVMISDGASLHFGERSSVFIGAGEKVLVDGSLHFASGSRVHLNPEGLEEARINVTGTLSAAGTWFLGGGPTTIGINTSGRLLASDSTFRVSRVVLASNGLQEGDVVRNVFDGETTLIVPYRSVGLLSQNISFADVAINAGTIRSGKLALEAIGSDTRNLRYVFTGGFTIGSLAGVTVAPGVTVVLPSSQTLAVDGTMTLGDGAQVLLDPEGQQAAQIVVAGKLTAAGAAFISSPGDGSSIAVDSGGTLDASYSSMVLGRITIGAGAAATITSSVLGEAANPTQLALDGGATVDIRGNDFRGVGPNGIIITGSSAGAITLAGNYWGTTDPAAIEAMILDRRDDATLPATNYQPVIARSTATAAAPASATFTRSGGIVNLTARVTAPDGTAVIEGKQRFSIWDGANQIGDFTPWVDVSNGVATAAYVLPTDTPVGSYTIRAEYSGSNNYMRATDRSQTLDIDPAATTATVSLAGTTFDSLRDQAVVLGADVSSPAGIVGEGAVTFTVYDGPNPLGPVVVATVVNGRAAAPYTLPAGTPGGSYRVRAVYSPALNFTASTGDGALSVAAAPTRAAGVDAQATFHADAAQPLALSATVTSVAGTINEGTVAFTIMDGATEVAPPIVAKVINGQASANAQVPAAMSAGSYTIRAVYGGTSSYAASQPVVSKLTVNPAATTTSVGEQATKYDPATRTVLLTASVASGASKPDEGIVTFIVRKGATTIGTISAPVNSGQVSAGFTLPAGMPAGVYDLQVTYSDQDPGNYTPSGGQSHLTIQRATPAITWATPSDIVYGTPLSAAQLNASSPVAGSLRYSADPGTVLDAGAGTLTVTFTPADPANYETATKTVRLNVAPAASSLVGLSSSQSVIYGQTGLLVSGTVVTGQRSPSGQEVTIRVGEITAKALVLSDGTFSTTLDVSTLGASPLPYEILYSYPGRPNFGPVSDRSTTLRVDPAPLTVAASNITVPFGSPVPAPTYTVSGLVNGDTQVVFTGVPATAAGASSDPGVYAVTQGTLSAGSNYAIAFLPGKVTVQPPPVAVTGAALTAGRPGGSAAVTVTFSGELNTSSATSLNHYRLVVPAGSRVFGGRRPRVIALRAVQYSWDGNVATVTLMPRRPLNFAARRLQLLIAGLVSRFGLTVAGNEDVSTTTYFRSARSRAASSARR